MGTGQALARDPRVRHRIPHPPRDSFQRSARDQGDQDGVSGIGVLDLAIRIEWKIETAAKIPGVYAALNPGRPRRWRFPRRLFEMTQSADDHTGRCLRLSRVQRLTSAGVRALALVARDADAERWSGPSSSAHSSDATISAASPSRMTLSASLESQGRRFFSSSQAQNASVQQQHRK